MGLVLLVGALSSACDRAAATASGSPAIEVVDPSRAPVFARGDARLSVAHSGVRRIEYPGSSGAGSAYRESIETDGNGNYSIRPLTTLADVSVSEWESFQLTQHVREGFLFRYRDFLVRDSVLFARNWRIQELQPQSRVAGRLCDRYRVERVEGESVLFELAVDATGLVLASEERDAAGEVVSTMVYETFRLGPAPEGIAWHSRANYEVDLDLQQSFGVQLGVQALAPRLLPENYGLVAAATVSDAQGVSWLKLTYTDGVEPLFFLQGLAAGELQQGKTARLDGSSRPSTLVVYRLGSATAVQGNVEGFELMAVGKAPRSEMFDLIESALP